MNAITCSYCGKDAALVGGSVIYPHRPDLSSKWFYQCKPCSAYVGCHPNSKKALGRLANAELRKHKSAAHAKFDPFWRNGSKTRSQAYKDLAQAMGLTEKDCHIGMFNIEQCQKVVSICESWGDK